MNIWIVNHYADPPDGLSTRSFDLARRMVERGHKVTILASVFSHYHFRPMRHMRPGSIWKRENIQGVNFVWLRTWPYRKNDWRRMLNMASFFGGVVLYGILDRSKPDVISGVTVHPLAALAGRVLAKRKHAHFVIEVTDLWPQSLIDMGRLEAESGLARGMRALERYLYSRAEVIFMLWRHTHAYVESLGVSTAKIVWLPHGVEMERYKGLEVDQPERLTGLRVMYLGAFAGSDGSGAFDVILGAAQVLQARGREDIQFLLVGAGTHRAEVIRLAADMALRNVAFPEPVPKAELGRVMSQADAFICGVRDLPIYRYGMSLNKLADYLVGGRPIVFYARSAYNPVDEAGAGFTVPPDDPRALADCVERVAMLSADERKRMGANGRKWALEHHNIPVLADRFLRTVENLRA
jgi:glycosyltransferase involved in cell wall biosynthesis